MMNATAPFQIMLPDVTTPIREVIRYDAPSMLLGQHSIVVPTRPKCTSSTAISSQRLEEDCAICLDGLKSEVPVCLKACNHIFHEACILDSLSHDPKCPVCRTAVGKPRGSCPSGSMTIRAINKHCPGFKRSTKTIEIKYIIPGGTQLPYHENPGQTYHSTTRTAYLPNDSQGQALLHRLKFAWMHGLTFTVGTSLSSGQTNAIVWNSIHHKTSLSGGQHGFPDPKFLPNCNESLDALNVPQAPPNGRFSFSGRNPLNNVTPETLNYIAPVSVRRAFNEALLPVHAQHPVLTTNTEVVQPMLPKISSSAPWASTDLVIPKSVPKAPPSSVVSYPFALPPLYSPTIQTIPISAPTISIPSAPSSPAPAQQFATPQGSSPSGTMTFEFTKEPFPNDICQTIKITYCIPSDLQLSYHPSPGVRYRGTTRTAYLPSSAEGQTLLKRLIFAWKHGLTFAIGTSLTTKESGVVVWSTIPHKTSLLPGEHGLPDASYIPACHGKLDALNVPHAGVH